MQPHEQLLATIRDGLIGDDRVLPTPFGERRVTYADYTASGRSLSFIEDFVRDEVMPLYANTHTETSGTGLQTTRFREDARALVHRGVGGGPDDCVIFAGSGATGAIDKLIDILNLRLPADLDARYRLRDHIPESDRPVVFIGPYEHHSNELPWRESLATVVTIGEDDHGGIDEAELEAELQRYAHRPVRIGSFSAASNVTGIASDTASVTRLLHRHGALAFWDFAAAGPYVAIEASPPGDPEASFDAVFLSPHKFVGGPGTPGVLVVKRALLHNRVPSVVGGGTVSYVSPLEHRYVTDPVHREEGGTPAIVESIRAGLVFQLKEAVGTELIEEREERFIRRAIEAWSTHPRIRILGNLTARRLSIVSFVIRHDERRYLHHNFVVALLNDLFGIQARGGCSCAGPYGHRLLGIDLSTSKEFEREIVRGSEGIKPGWVRVSFNYFLTDEVFDFLLRAVLFVAEHAHRFLPLYTFEPHTGRFRHAEHPEERTLRLDQLSYARGHLEYPSRRVTATEAALAGYLRHAERLVASLEAQPSAAIAAPTTSADFEHLRWFPLPGECAPCAPGAPSATVAG
jgi:selenocysteine lyase/cysteine desulfurase